MARPTIMTPDILERLRQAFAIGCTDEEACAYAKIGKTTLYNYQQDNPEFVEEKEELKKEPILKAKHTVVKSLDEAKNAQWYLERKSKDEFGIKVTTDNLNKNVEIPIDESKPVEEQLQDVLNRIKELQQ